MPTETIPAAEWVLNRVLARLSEAKMWPIKLAAFKHQSELSCLAALMGSERERVILCMLWTLCSPRQDLQHPRGGPGEELQAGGRHVEGASTVPHIFGFRFLGLCTPCLSALSAGPQWHQALRPGSCHQACSRTHDPLR